MSASLTITVNHVLEVGTNLAQFLEAYMASFEHLKQAIADLKTEVDAEVAQSSARDRRVADLEAQVEGGLTVAQADELQADLDSLKGSIEGIVADEPTP
jgi:chromosome segregation ATPase